MPSELQPKEKQISVLLAWIAVLGAVCPGTLGQTAPPGIVTSHVSTSSQHFEYDLKSNIASPNPNPQNSMGWNKPCKKNFILY